jgi:NADPH:quinone reductase-like Zn-dependent oxidoreductase
VRAAVAGVGPWDALIREGKTTLTPPLVLGSELSGLVEAVGPSASEFEVGDAVYRATNREFCGGYAEYVLARSNMMAKKPKAQSFVESASAPVVAVTAWQMLFEYAHARAGQTVLIQGEAGDVGAYAVQLAKHAGLNVVATAGPRDIEYVRNLGAATVINYQTTRFEDAVRSVDIVLDAVGRDIRDRSYGVLKQGDSRFQRDTVSRPAGTARHPHRVLYRGSHHGAAERVVQSRHARGRGWDRVAADAGSHRARDARGLTPRAWKDCVDDRAS